MQPGIQAAVAALRVAGVVAYPTEAVYGLGCDPYSRQAFDALFGLKRRPPEHGVLLIGAAFEHVAPFIGEVSDETIARARVTWPGPHTWIFPRSANTPEWLAGAHAGIALRVTAHPLAAELCSGFGGAIVSTSANRHGQPPARTSADVRTAFGDELSYILDGETGGLERPTPIRDAITGETIRS